MILQKYIIVFIILLLILMMIQDVIDVYTEYIKRDTFHRAMLALWEQRYRAASLACAIGLFYMMAR